MAVFLFPWAADWDVAVLADFLEVANYHLVGFEVVVPVDHAEDVAGGEY